LDQLAGTTNALARPNLNVAQRAVALNYFAYNFINSHRTLRVTPAMAAGVTDRLFDVSDIVAILEGAEAQRAA
jgi:hypothetical protein